MQVSINTAVFLPQLQAGTSQLGCVRALVGQPINNIEVRGEFFQNTTKNAELTQLSKICATNHWGFYYSIPEELFTAGQLNIGIADYLEMASCYHIRGLKISLGDPTGVSAEDLHTLSVWTQASSAKLTVENQPNANSQLPKFAQQVNRLLTSVPKLGYTFDSGNWYWLDIDPQTAFKSLVNAITVFHLKDIRQRETVLLDQGTTDWRSMLAELTTNVPVFLEYAIAPADLPGQIDLVNTAIAQRSTK